MTSLSHMCAIRQHHHRHRHHHRHCHHRHRPAHTALVVLLVVAICTSWTPTTVAQDPAVTPTAPATTTATTPQPADTPAPTASTNAVAPASANGTTSITMPPVGSAVTDPTVGNSSVAPGSGDASGALVSSLNGNGTGNGTPGDLSKVDKKINTTTDGNNTLITPMVSENSSASIAPALAQALGWTLVRSVDQLAAFKGNDSGTNGSSSSISVTLSRFSTNEAKSKDDLIDTHMTPISFAVNFQSDGKATIQEDSAYWGLTNNSVSKGAKQDAALFELVLDEQAAVLVMTCKDQVVRVASPSIDESTGVAKQVLVVSRVLNENSMMVPGTFGSANVIPLLSSSARILKKRYTDLSGANPALNGLLASFDFAALHLLGRELDGFVKMTTPAPSSPGDFYNFLFTATRMIASSPEYAANHLPLIDIAQKLDLNAMAKSWGITTSSALDSLSKYFSGRKLGETNQLWRSFVQAVTAAVTLRDLEESDGIFVANKTDVTKPGCVRDFYTASCSLALASSNASLAQKVNLTRILSVGGQGAVLTEKDADKKYWFENFVNVNSNASDTEGLIRELGLIQQVSGEFLSGNGTIVIGTGIADFVISNMSSFFTADEQSTTSMAQLDMGEEFRAIRQAAATFCSQPSASSAKKSKLCVMTNVMDQAVMLAKTARTMFSSNETTTISDKDEGIILKTLLEDAAFQKTMQSLNDNAKKVMEAIKNTTEDVIKNINENQLTTMLTVSNQLNANQQSYSEHVTRVTTFDISSQQVAFKQKMSEMMNNVKMIQENVPKLSGDLRNLALIAFDEAFAQTLEDLTKTITSGLSCFEQPLNAGDTVASLRDTTKDIMTIAGIEQVMKKVNGEMIKELKSTLDKLESLRRRLDELYAIAKKMLNDNNEVVPDSVKANSHLFMDAYGKFTSPVQKAEISSLAEQYRAVVEQLCKASSKIVGKPGCVNAPGEVTTIFGSMTDNLVLAEETMQILFDIVSKAVIQGSTKEVAAHAKELAGAADETAASLKKTWEANAQKRDEWFQNLGITQAMASVALMTNKVLIWTAAIKSCDRNTYLYGGLPNPPCDALYSSQAIKESDLIPIASLAPPTMDEKGLVVLDALIPTMPLFPGDTGYLDYNQLLLGKSQSFRLNYNESWLKDMHWDSLNLASSVSFVKSFEVVIMPPTDELVKSKGSTITVTIDSNKKSSFRVGDKDKNFVVPPFGFTTTYDEYTDEAMCADKANRVQLKSYNCNPKLLKICRAPITTTIEPGQPLPSLFSNFYVTAAFSSGGSTNETLVPLQSIATPLYLDAKVQIYKLDASRIPSGSVSSINSPSITTKKPLQPGLNSSTTGTSEVATETAVNVNSSSSSPASNPENKTRLLQITDGQPTPTPSAPSTTPTSPLPSTTSSAPATTGPVPNPTAMNTSSSTNPPSSSSPGSTTAVPSPSNSTSTPTSSTGPHKDTCCMDGQYYDARLQTCSPCPPGTVALMKGMLCAVAAEPSSGPTTAAPGVESPVPVTTISRGEAPMSSLPATTTAAPVGTTASSQAGSPVPTSTAPPAPV